MMRPNNKTFYGFMAAIAIIGVIGTRLHMMHCQETDPLSDISLANINALMDAETDPEKDNTDSEKGNTNSTSRPLLGCADRSCVIYCHAKCKKCRTIFKAVGGYGPTVDVKGKCNRCGSTSFSS